MITASDYEDKGVLTVNASTYYFDTLRPYIQKVIGTCRTDLELCRTLDKIINKVDSSSIRKEYDEIQDAFISINKVITDSHYFDTSMKSAPETEKEMIRGLIQKINDYLLIVKCEPKQEVKKPEQCNRIDYNKPENGVGENASYATHNMQALNQPNPKKRLPNY